MRRARAADATGVSLFPCLAVMLSLAGVMIVVLVVMARCAALDATQSDVSAPAAAIATQQREALRKEIVKLEEVHSGLAVNLDQKRQELGYIENQRRELEQKGLELHAALEEQRRLVTATAKQRDEAKADIQRLRSAVAETEAALTEMRQNGTANQPSYAIVPYEGPNRTRRRPIYIECSQDRITLQPEGVVLGEADFEGPLDSGNPLAAALRATREYLDQQRKLTGEDPYPLILIRPDGVGAYYVVRQAIADWGAEFGYELIEQDWKLKYPPADPTLVQIQARVVEESRQRQRLLAARGKRDLPKRKTYVVAPTGGIVQDRAGARFGDPALPYDPEADGSGGGRRQAAGSNPKAEPGGTTAQARGLQSFGMGKDRERRGAKAGAGPSTNMHAASGTGAASQPVGSQEDAGDVAEPRIGESRVDEPKPSAGGSDEMASTAARAASQSLGTFAPIGGTLQKATIGANDPKESSLAKTRGKNWGLQHVARGSIPITRPIRVVCFEDRATIAPIDDTYQPKVIPFAAQTRDSVDPLVAAVWEQTRQWGIAGKGMYWRPVLSFDVQPGGQERYEELRKLLDDSGLVVRRKGEPDTNPKR
jgi:hypothetical protein